MTILQILRLVPAFLIEILAALLRWLTDRPVRAFILALILLSLWLWLALTSARSMAEDRRVQAAQWQGKFATQKAEMLKFGTMVRDARIEAARLDRANIERVRAEWAAQIGKVRHDYSQDLAAARSAVADRMRGRPTGAGSACPTGDSGCAAVPPIPTLSSRPVRAGHAAIVDEGDIDAATVNALRLEYLIAAWKAAAAISVNRP